MKNDEIKLVRKIIIFIIIFMVIFWTINQLYINTIMNEKSLTKAQNQFSNLNKDNLISVAFGDSHVACGINPHFINNSFNYGSSAESYEQTYYKVKYMINNFPNVEYYILPIDYSSFLYYTRDKYSNIWYWSKFMSYNELNLATNKSLISLIILNNFPLIGTGNEIASFISSSIGIEYNEKTIIDLGWQSQQIHSSFNSFDLSHRTRVARERVRNQFINYFITKEGLIDSFYNIIDLLEKNNKTIILIKYPITREYYQAIKDANITSEFYSEFYNLTLKHSKIHIFDYQENYLDNQELFADSDHIDYLGAEVLSKKINEDLKKI